MSIRIFVGPQMGDDAYPIGQTDDGAPVFADSEGVAATTDITSAFVPGSIRFTEKP